MAKNSGKNIEHCVLEQYNKIEKIINSEGNNLTVNNLGILKDGNSYGDLDHLNALSALMEAFKGRESVKFYIEHRVPNSTSRPADILIVSRDIGFLLIEVKGFVIKNIDSVTGSTIKGSFYGYDGNEIDAFSQAEKSMYQFKKHYDRKADIKGIKGHPQFDYFVFFPSISLKDWKGRKYDECMSMEQLLFKEDYDHPKLISEKIYKRVVKIKESRRKNPVLSLEQEKTLLAALGESDYIVEPGKKEKIDALRKKNPNFEINLSNCDAVEQLTKEVEESKKAQDAAEKDLESKANELSDKEKEISILKKQQEEERKKQLYLLNDMETNKHVESELKEAEKRKQKLEEELREKETKIKLLVEESQKKERKIRNESEKQMSLGKRILSYYETEKKLTTEQQEVVDTSMESSPYLIRGVAGSGKSVVLTKHVVSRVVAVHQKHESGLKLEKPLRVGVVCFNRSLAPYLRETITLSLKDWCSKEQDPAAIASQYVECHSMNSFLYCFSKKGYCKYKKVDFSYGGTDYSHYIREFKILKDTDPQKYDEMLFDTLYVDESQDLSPEGFKVLMEMLRPGKNNEKNLIIFYDDAQNLYGRKRPIWKELGIRVDVGRRSRFLSTCHRNTKETLDFAFNMLMGTFCSQNGKKVNMASFADVANLKKRGLVSQEDDLYRVNFSKRFGDPSEVRGFRNRQDEKRWVYNKVRELIDKEGVLPDDILILFPTKRYYDDLDRAFQKLSMINGVIHPHGQDKDKFPFASEYLTISTIHSAKGLGAPVVFLIGVDKCQDDERGRAAFYVGATRAKLKLFVTGVTGFNSMVEESITLKKALES